jgi:hypothetical protein
VRERESSLAIVVITRAGRVKQKFIYKLS